MGKEKFSQTELLKHLAENNNDEDKAWGCFGQVYALMDRNCNGSDNQGMLSVSYEVCFMSEMVFAYQNLIPPSWF